MTSGPGGAFGAGYDGAGASGQRAAGGPPLPRVLRGVGPGVRPGRPFAARDAGPTHAGDTAGRRAPSTLSSRQACTSDFIDYSLMRTYHEQET